MHTLRFFFFIFNNFEQKLAKGKYEINEKQRFNVEWALKMGKLSISVVWYTWLYAMNFPLKATII